MTIGKKIKNARLFRNMTLKELGIAIGFEEKNADIRMSQYESGTRVPKEETLNKIAEVLNVNSLMLKDNPFDNAENIISTLFDLDNEFPINLVDVVIEDDIDKKEQISLVINYHLVQDFFREWKIRKQELSDGTITKEEYLEWKLNWPNTCDDNPEHKWRKD